MEKKVLETTRGFQYTYYVAPAAEGKSTLLLLHGWPDHAAMWFGLADHYLLPRGFGLVIPDCLGYGGTAKPTDPKEYNPIGLTRDFCDILDAEEVNQVIVGGHDWGAGLSQRFHTVYPERCSGLIMLNVPAVPRPEHPLNLEQLAKYMIESIGYFPGWYWYLLSDPVEGPLLLHQHTESLFDALHAKPESWMTTLCTKDGLKDWLDRDMRGGVQEYATSKMRQEFVERMTRDGFEASLCYYRALVTNIIYEQDNSYSVERYRINVPYLFVACAGDVVCRSAGITKLSRLGMTPHLTVEHLDAGHWCILEKPKEVGEIFVRWLEANY